MQAPPSALIEWPEPIFQLIDFIGLFLASGSVGFRYSALRGRLLRGRPAGTAPTFHDAAGRQAAFFGICGAVITLARMIQTLPEQAARAKLPVAAFVTSYVRAGA